MSKGAPASGGRLAAGVALSLCCGLVMGISLGLVAITGLWLLVGLGVAAAAVCVGVLGWLSSRRSAGPLRRR